MMDIVVQSLLGIFLVFIGIQNMKGNISSLHSYHRKRIAEEDKAIFGKKVGMGTILCGLGLVINGVFMMLTQYTGNEMFQGVGGVIMTITLLAGIVISLYAIIKYNKGLF